MLLTNFSLKHPITVFVLTILIVIIGAVSYLVMPREAAPDINIATIVVMVPYPGVSPEDVESLVTNRMEAKFEDLKDLDQMTSTSSEGIAAIILQFQPGTDTTESLTQVRDRVSKARADLPQDIMEPVVQEISTSDWPILKVVVAGDAELVRLKRIGQDLKTEIEALEGVLEVDLAGGLDREIRVEVNLHQMLSYGLSLDEVIGALRMENINVPGGPVEEGDIRYTVRIPAEFKDPDKIKNIVVATRNGHPITVREIGVVIDGYKERSTLSRFMGKEGVSLSVKKQSGANIIKLVDQIKKLVDAASVTFPPGTTHEYLNDFSKYIRQRVEELENHVVLSMLLIVAVLLMFIGARNALLVAIAVPLSAFLTFAILNAMGITLNMIVLFSLVLVLGMLVDDAIVIVENIYRHARMGKKPLDAAREATAEVGWPVITSTLTTVAAFAPLLAWPGIMGEFLSYLPLTVCISLMCSLFVALVINPVITAVFLRVKTRPGKSVDEEHGIPDNWFMRGYRRVLEWSIGHRWVVLPAMVVMLVAAVSAFFMSRPMVEFFPSTTPDRANITIEAPEGTRFDATNRVSQQVEGALAGLPNVKNYIAEVGYGSGFNAAEGLPYLARLSLDFQGMEAWTENPFQTLEHIRAAIASIPGAAIRVQKQAMGPPTGAPVNIEVAGQDYEQLSRVADEIQALIKDTPSLTDLKDDYSNGRPEIQLHIDRTLSSKLVLLGLGAVAGTIRTAIYGTKATVYRLGDEEYDVTVRLQESFRKHREDLLNLTITGREGRQIPLSDVVRLDSTVGATSIKHMDRNRVITVSAETEGRPGAEVLRDVRQTLKAYSPKGATLSYTGENKEMEKSQAFLSQALLIGLFLIFMILITQFDNVAQVSIIMFTVLLSFSGVFLGLFVNRMPFSVLMTGLGIISLAGVVVKNGIVIIDFINHLREKGLSVKDACIQASMVRVRPVFLTACTAVLGLIPMAQGIEVNFMEWHFGRGAASTEFWGPMAIAVTWGLSFATILTLVVVPVLYHTLQQSGERVTALFARRPVLRRVAWAAGIVLGVLVTYKIIAGLAAAAGV